MKITLSKNRWFHSQAAFTVAEFMSGVLVGLIVVTAVAALGVYSARNFASFYAVANLDLNNRKTTDQLTKDLRSVQSITNYTGTSFVANDYDNTPITYSYDSTAKTLTRIKGTYTNVLLSDINRLTLSVGTRNM